MVPARGRRAPSPPGRYEAAGDRIAGGGTAGVRGRKHLRAAVRMARLRAGHRGGVAGGRPGRLVCRDRPVPAPARPANPPHRDRGDAQGTDRADPRQLRAESLPIARCDRGESAARASCRARRAMARRSRARPPDLAPIREWTREDTRLASTQRAAGSDHAGRAQSRPVDPGGAGARQDAGARAGGQPPGRAAQCGGPARSRRGAQQPRVDSRARARGNAVERLLHDMVSDPNHPLRGSFDKAIRDFIDRLQHSPEVIARAEALKEEWLMGAASDDMSRRLWEGIREAIANYGRGGGNDGKPSPLDSGLSEFGIALLSNPTLLVEIDDLLIDLTASVVEKYRHEIGDLIAQTVASWDPAATSRRFELAVGRDLQFVRINGTLVGGLVGLLIYTIIRFLH